MEWDVRSVDCWSRGLGMASLPLFGGDRAQNGSHTVFLDGNAASFALSIADDPDLVHDSEPLSWTWSANLRHFLVLNSTKDLFLRQWGAPDSVHRLPVPRSVADLEALVEKLGAVRRPREANVIFKMISVFKLLREVLFSYPFANNLDVIQVFNSLIKVAKDVGLKELAQCSSVEDLGKLDSGLRNLAKAPEYQDANIDHVVFAFINCAPAGLRTWDASLLLRHASGELYQEAHFELERHSAVQRSLFGGYELTTTGRGTAQRDARLTPPELARTLVEQALGNLSNWSAGWIVDPACGSGVFLQEVLRALQAQKQRGLVRIAGFDRSPVSVEIARFCMESAVEDARRNGLEVQLRIEKLDALTEDWGSPIAVLMNPPFASYKDLDDRDREKCTAILGKELAKGHYDKSMAFVWKAVTSVQSHGVVASVLPSTLLDSFNAERWRQELTAKADLRCVGRFGGYGYFREAMVSPAFIVLTTPPSPGINQLTVVTAEEGHEEVAMRALRKHVPISDPTDDIFVSFEYESKPAGATWMPKTYRYGTLLDALRLSLPTVDQLFEVQQGAITGNNRAFILSKHEVELLPEAERNYFRPAAGTRTIRKGALLVREYVFFPYGPHSIESEEELRTILPEYYKHLKPFAESLKRKRDKETLWWTLEWPRAWQKEPKPKIVTAYFGTAGNFAFDESGNFVSVQGYVWNVRSGGRLDLVADRTGSFYATNLPYAYVAILNSKPFELLLSCFCTRVAGGQFNLSKRYVSHIPMPDLADGVPGDLVQELAELGESLGYAPLPQDRLASLAAAAYGVPLSDWGLESAGR